MKNDKIQKFDSRAIFSNINLAINKIEITRQQLYQYMNFLNKTCKMYQDKYIIVPINSEIMKDQSAIKLKNVTFNYRRR